MTPEERQRRCLEASHELADMAKHKLLPDLVSEREGELLEELDRFEYEEGVEGFFKGSRDGKPK